MRPSLLDPLFAPVSGLSGVGPKLTPVLDRLLAPENGKPARILDVLFHLPWKGIDRRSRPKIADANPGEVVTLSVTVSAHRPPVSGRVKAPWKVLVEDETGDVTLVFFHTNKAYLEKTLPLGSKRYVSGMIELWDGMRQMVHPDRVLDEKGLAALPPIEPVYALSEGVSARFLNRIAGEAVKRLPNLPEWQDVSFLKREHMPTFGQALTSLHNPEAMEVFDPSHPARRRLALDELLATQLALGLVRQETRKGAGRASEGDGRLTQAILKALPWPPTNAQTRALDDIRGDMASSHRMLRLLQGDVGSGKTLVALLAMIHAAEARRQSALMAPTELLARQHYERLAPLATQVGLEMVLLTGRDKGAGRKQALEALASGRAMMAVGTHALFQEGVAFHDLGLAVIDEQHRFGVHQRLAIGSKGEATDILVMTATPIPRTLALSYFGDMDVSVLDEKPAGRQPIATKALPLERLDEVVGAVGRALTTGARVYWICPLVGESETLDLAAAEERFESLQKIYGADVGLLHGKMAGKDKDTAMGRFARGDTKILVSTTVVEVGVDVPEATIMVIEHAERFGLAQLHQLRGRIGRGSAASTCLLLYKAPLGQVASARLDIMRQTEDGFRIAEEDLRLRGEGEMLGTRQSGMPDFRLAHMESQHDLLEIARDAAKLILARDPTLNGDQGHALRVLLYLFERDAAIRLLRAG